MRIWLAPLRWPVKLPDRHQIGFVVCDSNGKGQSQREIRSRKGSNARYFERCGFGWQRFDGRSSCPHGIRSDSLYVIQTGRVKVSVKSEAGREATLDILSDADLVGKDSMAGQVARTASDLIRCM